MTVYDRCPPKSLYSVGLGCLVGSMNRFHARHGHATNVGDLELSETVSLVRLHMPIVPSSHLGHMSVCMQTRDLIDKEGLAGITAWTKDASTLYAVI